MNTGTQSPDRLFGSDVTDSTNNKIGTVDGVWVDDATGELEFIGVKTGWLVGKTHIIPAAQAEVSEGLIQVPYGQDQVKDAPSFGTDTKLSPADEDEIYAHYGLDRSTSSSPSGLPQGGVGGRDYGVAEADTLGTRTTTDSGYSRGGTDLGADEQRIKLSAEELQVGTRQVEAGRIRIRKVVRAEEVEQPVQLRREEVKIDRVSARGTEVPDTAFQEGAIDVPVMREEAVVSKEARVTGQVQVGKRVEIEQQTVSGEVRKEDIEVDRDIEADGTSRRDRTPDTL